MPVDGFLRVDGIDAVVERLIACPRYARPGLQSAMRSAFSIISKGAKANAPVLRKPRKYRKAGTLKKAIAVRTSKFSKREGNIGVFIGVRPINKKSAKRLGAKDAKNPNDPYYWKWQEFRPGNRHFLTNAATSLSQGAVNKFIALAPSAIDKAITKAKAKGKG